MVVGNSGDDEIISIQHPAVEMGPAAAPGRSLRVTAPHGQKPAELQVALNSAERLIQATFLAARGRIGINCKRLAVGGVIWVSEPT